MVAGKVSLVVVGVMPILADVLRVVPVVDKVVDKAKEQAAKDKGPRCWKQNGKRGRPCK